MDDGELRELLGAYALDALDADETKTMEEFLRRDPVAAAEAARLSEAATWIGATEALAPPSRLRESVLGDATRRAEVRAYRAEADRFDALLDAVDESDYDQPTWNGLSVRELVAHLAGMETSCAEGVGAPVGLDAPVGIEARTEVFVAAYPDPQAARLVLRDAVDSLAGWAEAGGEVGRFPWWGSEAPRRNLLGRACVRALDPRRRHPAHDRSRLGATRRVDVAGHVGCGGANASDRARRAGQAARRTRGACRPHR